MRYKIQVSADPPSMTKLDLILNLDVNNPDSVAFIQSAKLDPAIDPRSRVDLLNQTIALCLSLEPNQVNTGLLLDRTGVVVLIFEVYGFLGEEVQILLVVSEED